MSLVLRYTWVDVFAARPLQGNQLCVFAAPDDLPVETMKWVARELNHAETTFLQRATSAGADCRVRILLPTPPLAKEIPFAGHPVLGGACVAALERTGPRVVRCETGVGILPVTVTPTGGGAWDARMEQPLPRTVRVIPRSVELAAALGLAPDRVRGDLPIEAVDNGMQTVLIPLASVPAVQRATPDLGRLRRLLGRDGLCTLVFAPGGLEADADVHCRVFNPFDVLPEDAATGSANGPLGEYLVRHGVAAGPVVQSEQGHALGRPSRLTIAVERQGARTRAVYVSGRVQLVGRGEFVL